MTGQVLRLAAVCLAMALPQEAMGWWCEGHMLVAQVAGTVLKPGVVAQLNELAEYLNKEGPFEQSPDYIQSACWADDIKKTINPTTPWHFINLPYNPTGIPNVPEPDPVNDVVDVLEKMSRTIKDRAEYKANTWELSFAVADFIHFVGDSHQPLHCATLFSQQFPPPKGDLGGNLFKITYDNKSSELHAFWDSVGGLYQDAVRPLNASAKAQFTQIVTELTANYTFPPNVIQSMNYTAWAQDSFNLAVKYAYATMPGSTLTDTYIAAARDVAKSQVTLAGLRLGYILNAYFA